MAKNKDTDLNELDDLLNGMQKKYGKESIRKPNEIEIVEVIPVGDISIDYALGVGGFPKGRIAEIYGLESSGKTTLALHAISEAQKMGLNTAFVDVEHALDPVYASNLGVDIDKMIISQPDNGEDALSIVNDLVASNKFGLVILDSVASLVTKAELEGEMGDSHMALNARLMSQAMRKLTAVISRSKCVVIFINQLRHKIGGYGNPEVTTGGNALKFYTSIRIEVRRGKINATKSEVDHNEIKSNDVTIKVVKNKVAPPFRKVEVPIVYGKGFDKIQSLVSMASSMNILTLKGSWYSYKDDNIGQGKEKTATYLVENPNVLQEIEQLTRDQLFPKLRKKIEETQIEETVKE
jgi:recombination protein RecA